MLRENQIEPVRVAVEFFKEKKPKPSLIVCPTAFGKSHLAAHIIDKTDDKFVMLQPTKELLIQNYEKYKALGGEASIYSASMKQKEIGRVTYATLGSIKNIGKDFAGAKLMVDECHLYPRDNESMFGGFLRASGIKHILGLTATPLKLQTNSFEQQTYSILKMLTSSSKHGNLFKDILYISQIEEMVRLGFWAYLKYELHDFSGDKLKFNSTQAEYTESSLADSYEDQGIEDKIVDKVREIKYDRKSILIFVPSVEKAKALSARIPGSRVVYGDMPDKERTEVIGGFKDFTIQVVINVNVLSVGFDHPGLDAIILGRSTASLPWLYQALGRGTRIFEGKDFTLVIDFAGNIKRFGKIEDLHYEKDKRTWKLYGEGGKLLTGIPIHEIGLHIKQVPGEIILPWGTHKGKRVRDASEAYLDWLLRNMRFNQYNIHVKDEIMRVKSGYFKTA